MSRPRATCGAALLLLAAGCGGSGGDPMPSSGEVTLLDVQSQVFSPRCALSGCHIGPGAPVGLDLSSGQTAGNVVGVPSAEVPSLLRVAPFDPSDSYLYMKLTSDPRILGDPMPLTGGALSAGQIDLVRRWIEDGAM